MIEKALGRFVNKKVVVKYLDDGKEQREIGTIIYVSDQRIILEGNDTTTFINTNDVLKVFFSDDEGK